MPLFHRKSDEEKRLEEETREHQVAQAADAQISLDALQSGGIPVQAQRRLDELRSRTDGFFTSDLSVNEFVLAGKEGLRPLTQVMGSSIYHVGWRNFSRNFNSGEMVTVTEALNEVRIRALSRLAEEAGRVSADVVVGVHVERKNYDWAADIIEFSAIGTAMSLGARSAGGDPALTNLSGADFWKLYQSGHWPAGVVGGQQCVPRRAIVEHVAGHEYLVWRHVEPGADRLHPGIVYRTALRLIPHASRGVRSQCRWHRRCGDRPAHRRV